MTWHDKIKWLYDHIYNHDNGGMFGLAKDLNVSRLTVQYWYHWPNKINPLTNRPVEPNYLNRQAIDELYEAKIEGPVPVYDDEEDEVVVD